MQSLIIPIESQSDLSLLMAILERMGIKASLVSEDDTRMQARKSLVSYNRKIKKTNLSENEIHEEVKDYRKTKHVQK
ncbi:MAG: hypothetical protein A2275_13935 [Bacteroidetes bacterium RIFOXYA12_FULL_35_11]|nr:MAG: hypothetical protein A2X01_03410 [Bacteroidetes bacterium GWF2_35_48]OFY73515.1 MAG: hypothetical protein A2275_13935 [Bacteroidetes bacterium RIFOXYA12_FULL_35_11]OFZ02336.1 MAG: hypothetical protein A2491_09745 [Bacteroidetes bacterium RIFOXYC12_FULL_35_7]HBX51079.1 hypothetical protein [Bacteroidales bacterium]